jgi:hypothetical protein
MEEETVKRTLGVATIFVLLFASSISSFADFQYTEKSKITGGAMASSMKVIGVFSKDARQAGQGTTSTISVKGNKMRRESDAGTAEIVDLDGHRMIQLDLKHKTYSILTFEQLRAQIEEARRKMAEQQAKHSKQDPQVKITPKIEVTPGTGTRQILNYTAKEMKTRVELEMQSQDPKNPGTANTWMSADSFIAPVKGYDELKHFYMVMARELDWMPGAILGANPQMNVASVELRKSTAKLTGLPLLQYTSMGMGAPQPANTNPSTQEQPKSSGNPISKGLGGLFGRKKEDNSQKQASSPDSAGGSLMDMTTEVTSVSNTAIDASLFEIPAGFKQVENKKESGH